MTNPRKESHKVSLPAIENGQFHSAVPTMRCWPVLYFLLWPAGEEDVCIADINRVDNLIMKAGSVVGSELKTLQQYF